MPVTWICALPFAPCLLTGDNAYIQAGAGIVYDSKAEFEYKEILQKAKAMFTVVEEVENDVAAFR